MVSVGATYYKKFDIAINTFIVWGIAVLNDYIKPFAQLLFIPFELFLLQMFNLDFVQYFEQFWHILAVVGGAVMIYYTIYKIRRETIKTNKEIILKDKEILNYEMSHKFDELRLDIMFAEEKLAAYRNADEKLKNMSIDEFVELVNKKA